MISPKQYSISNDDDNNKKATTKHFYWSFMLWLFLLLKAPFGFICATVCVSHRTYCICNIRICIRLIQLESLLVFLWVEWMCFVFVVLYFVVLCIFYFVHEVLPLLLFFFLPLARSFYFTWSHFVFIFGFASVSCLFSPM